MARLEVKTQWQGLDEAFAALEAECTDIVRGLTVSAWRAVLRATPQYSGDMAASWNYCLNTPTFTNRAGQAERVWVDEMSFIPYRRGDSPAIAIANSSNAGRDAAFKLGDRVIFTNGSDHGQGDYAQQAWDGTLPLRTVNLMGRPLGRTLDEIESRYGTGISRAAAGQIKNLRIA